jgi:superfamily II DNA/RNA helicase
MPSLTLQHKLLQLESFRKDLLSLTVQSVRLNFPILQTPASTAITERIQWPHMLLCASILAQSGENDSQDAALRIAQHCLSVNDTTIESRLAAMSILESLTNDPALKLAVSRNRVSAEYASDLPTPLKLERIRRRIEHSIADGPNNFMFLNRFQSAVFKKAPRADWTSVSAPTSAGKSFILLKLIQQYLSRDSTAHIVYVVPTRALIKQVETDIAEMIAKYALEDTLVTSVPQVPEDDIRRIIFVYTQERLHYLLNDIPPEFQFDLLIVDEAQKIDDGARGVLLQQTIESVVKHSELVKVVFSSPMTANPNLFLEDASIGKKTECISSEMVTVNQNLIWASQVKGNPKKWKLLLYFKNEPVELGIVDLPHSPSISKRLPYLAFSMSDPNGGSLIYANGQAEAEKIALQLSELLRDGFAEDSEINALVELVGKVINTKYALVETLKYRVAFHYGNMPLLIRSEIERLFKSGKIRFLICTSTLLEGVNLPAKSIFLRNPKRGMTTPLDQTDFWNLAGRAGRWGKEFQGNVVCVDAEQWKTQPPTYKNKHHVQRALDVVAQNATDFLAFINSGTPRNIAVAKPELEHAFVYFINHLQKNESLANEALLKRYEPAFLSELESACRHIMSTVSIPRDLIERNPGVSPVAQQNLLNYFASYDKDPETLIPYPPEAQDATGESYVHIIGRIGKHLSGEPLQLTWPRAILVVNWMRGYTLARIISDNWNYWKTKSKSLQSVIRSTMQDVEEYARFKFVKYASCYVDVLRYHFTISGNLNLIDRIPKLHIFLEFGASQQTQISLMDLGLSRVSAIALSEIIADTELDRAKCLGWISSRDVEALNLSPIILEEVKQVKNRFQ